MILSCQGISKSFGEKVILEDASFHIEETQTAEGTGRTQEQTAGIRQSSGSAAREEFLFQDTHRDPKPGQESQKFAVNLGIKLKF